MITKNGFVLLNKFFAYDPKRRVTAEDALKHEYFEVNNNNNNNDNNNNNQTVYIMYIHKW